MKKFIALLIIFLIPSICYGSPSNTMSISPSAVDGTVITASDENTRNNEVSTKFNAHDHNDIDQVGNTLSVGDATAGNKTIQANNADSNKPYIRYDDTNNRWVISQDGSEVSTIVTLTGSSVAYYYLPTTPAGSAGQVIGLSAGVLYFLGGKNTGEIDVHDGTTRVALTPGQVGTTIVSSGFGQVPSYDFGTKIFVGSFNRDVSTASGTQGVTGVGFKPRFVIVYTTINGATGIGSWGFSTVSTGGGIHDTYNDTVNTYSGNSGVIDMTFAAGATYNGVLSSFDTDGFTITWTKGGSPTGTSINSFIAIR